MLPISVCVVVELNNNNNNNERRCIERKQSYFLECNADAHCTKCNMIQHGLHLLVKNLVECIPKIFFIMYSKMSTQYYVAYIPVDLEQNNLTSLDMPICNKC